MGRRKTNEEFQEELRQLREQGHDVYTDDIYIDCKTSMWFYCSKGHRWPSKPEYILSGRGCPYCAGKKVIIGETSLWDTRPDIACLLEDPQDGYKYSAGSGKKVNFICKCCGAIHLKTICDVCTYGFSCSNCSDGISYPNKFSRALLSQLDIDYIEYEWNPEWLKPYFYDNYFEYNGEKWVLEMDGGISHGNRKFNSKEKDVEGKKRDVLKDSLAIRHNVNVIRIDCNYLKDNRFEYIKNNILNSELSVIFDLSNIDWILCDKQAQSKLVAQSAELYKQGLSMPEMKEILKYNEKTIRRWLKQATNVGLCNYSAHELRVRGGKAITIHNVAVNRYTLNYDFIDSYISMAEAEKYTGITKSNICVACDKPNRSAGGYRWYKASNPNQPDKSKIILITQN